MGLNLCALIFHCNNKKEGRPSAYRQTCFWVSQSHSRVSQSTHLYALIPFLKQSCQGFSIIIWLHLQQPQNPKMMKKVLVTKETIIRKEVTVNYWLTSNQLRKARIFIKQKCTASFVMPVVAGNLTPRQIMLSSEKLGRQHCQWIIYEQFSIEKNALLPPNSSLNTIDISISR